ncbi:MAG: LPXTG cell wall anchor domain-containing protein [Clostridia bacterium]|nr:LPXTG cell wall anchor domain-containing protein [Clostridia bacterium]
MEYTISKSGKAPAGYVLSDQVVKIEINDKGVFADNILLEENNNVYSFIYYNSLAPVIQTGSEINYILTIGLMTISLIGIVTGVIVLKRKRKNN